MTQQLVLNVTLPDDATFANFYAGSNQSVVDYLQSPLETLLYLQGKPACGLTHLLQAACHRANRALYLPLRHFHTFSPALLDNCQAIDVIALDDIDAIAGQARWEEAIFHVFNECVSTKKGLIIASHFSIAHLTIQLPDLRSRLQSMLTLTIHPLTDDEKSQALQHRAKNRGLILSDEVAHFMLTHAPRDMQQLFALLERLDKLSLQRQRRLTIPFIKQVMYNH